MDRWRSEKNVFQTMVTLFKTLKALEHFSISIDFESMERQHYDELSETFLAFKNLKT